MKKSLLVLVLFGLSLAPLVVQDAWVIAVDGLKMRSSPSLQGQSSIIISYGEKVAIVRDKSVNSANPYA